MSERQQMIYMQARMIRLFSEKWGKPVETTACLFTEHRVLEYIEECFGIFHVEGDDEILEDITAYLKNKGVREFAESY